MSRKRNSPVSPLKVGVGIMTGGLSLLITGVLKNNDSHAVRARTNVRVRKQGKANRRTPCESSARGQQNQQATDLVGKRFHEILEADGMKWYIPKLSFGGWILAILFAMFVIFSFLRLDLRVAFAFLAIEYFALLLNSRNNVLYAKNYLRLGVLPRYNEAFNWEDTRDEIRIERRSRPKKDNVFAAMQRVDAMDGHEFEHFIADLLRALGYEQVSVTRGSGDQGVDVLAQSNGIKYAIQCKNYASPLGNTPVQEVRAGKDFYECHVGVVVTNNYFTKGGKALAEKVRVILWDRDKLIEMMRSAKNQ